MTESDRDKDLVEKARRLLDAQADQVPDGVKLALARSRHRAVTGLRPARQRIWRLRPWPTAALGTVAVLLVAGMLVLRSPAPVPLVAEPVQDLDVITAQADLDLLEELDFMAWVAEQWADAG